ncbi:bZIP transcription factor TRAB1-like [Phalaenopsis equestris]|uniref:bZIP transcription factor TRAB1-like n=1 Tax=Phalaenopsis equestris TaxID=78828 RepID=UPI0009E206A6|nr:bZIP transcription factor TRAB1-like [Phalaenopsis equestris]
MWSDGNDCDRQTAAASAAGIPLLSRQPSIFSLTFEEFQTTMGGIGKELGSMNMDEFLKNIWIAEESQAMAVALGAPEGGAGVLQHQGSFNLPRTLSLKTVDDVWRGVITDNVEIGGRSDLQKQQRQPTIGEITLEEFLVRAGVVREEINTTVSTPVDKKLGNDNSGVYYGDLSASGNNNSAFASSTFPQAERCIAGVMPNSLPSNSGTNLTIPVAGARPYAAHLPLGADADLGKQRRMRDGIVGIADPAINNGLISGIVGLATGTVSVVTAGSPAKHVTSGGTAKGNAELSSFSGLSFAFNGPPKGRKSDGTVEKILERRQRRMIKNRESAARSRARKQAYTMELETEVAILKEKNQELEKKQAEVLEMQKKQILELNHQLGQKRSCLRRTYTGPW